MPKRGIVFRGVIATPNSINLPPHTANFCVSPAVNCDILSILRCLKTETNLIEFCYDLLLECWLLFKLVESYILSKRLIGAVHKVSMKK